jgi:hypothetical protein
MFHHCFKLNNIFNIHKKDYEGDDTEEPVTRIPTICEEPVFIINPVLIDRYNILHCNIINIYKKMGERMGFDRFDADGISNGADKMLKEYIDTHVTVYSKNRVDDCVWFIAVVSYWMMAKYCAEEIITISYMRSMVNINKKEMRRMEVHMIQYIDYNFRRFL